MEAEGWLISVGGTPREIMNHDPEFTYRRLLDAAKVLCPANAARPGGTETAECAANATRSGGMETAEWLRVPIVSDPKSLAALDGVASASRNTLVEGGGNVRALIKSLEQAAGRENRVALLAAAGDIDGVLKSQPDGPARLHNLAVAALSALAEKPTEPTSYVEWVVGVAALLDGSEEYRRKVREKFGPTAPSEDNLAGAALARAVAHALSAVGIAWGDAADDSSWAFRWEIERRAVRELSQTAIRFEAGVLGPMLLARLGCSKEAKDRLAADAKLRRAFGIGAPAEVCLRRLDLLRALRFVEDGNHGFSGAAVRFAAEDEEADRRDVLADVLQAIIRMRMGPEAARCPDPVPLAQRFEQLARTLTQSAAARSASKAAAAFAPLVGLFAGLAERKSESAKGWLQAESKLDGIQNLEEVLECFDAALAVVPPDHRRVLEAPRARLLFVTVSLLVAEWRKAGGEAESEFMRRMLKYTDDIVRTEGQEAGYRLQWLMVRWGQASAGGDASAERLERVRRDVMKYYDWVRDRAPIWEGEFRELLEEVNAVPGRSVWLRGGGPKS